MGIGHVFSELRATENSPEKVGGFEKKIRITPHVLKKAENNGRNKRVSRSVRKG
jgi:hypothetical protein